MSHDHSHDHSHYHIHANEKSTRIVVFISVCTMFLELYFGYTTNSKALMMDGWHMLSHVLVLLLAWLAYYYIRKKQNKITHKQQHRVISLSGFASAVAMLVITLFMIFESIESFQNSEIDVTNGALLVSVIGLVVNGVSAFLLHREEEKRDVNLYAAYLHAISDVVISFFAIISLVVVKYTGFVKLDSVLALVGALVILKWSVELIQKSWQEILEMRKH
jgi:cation diffusion facilitator family transporter